MVSGAPDTLSMVALQIAHGDVAWDPKSFDLERDLALAIEKVGYAVNAIDPDRQVQGARRKVTLPRLERRADLRGQHRRLLRVGAGRWAADDDWLRLFMVPGMGHCQGGAGPDQVNWPHPLERWRESGRRPSASKPPRRQQPDRDDAPALSVSADRALFRRGQHQRRWQLRLGAAQRALAALVRAVFCAGGRKRNRQQRQRGHRKATPGHMNSRLKSTCPADVRSRSPSAPHSRLPTKGPSLRMSRLKSPVRSSNRAGSARPRRCRPRRRRTRSTSRARR